MKLSIIDLHATAGDKEILQGIHLEVAQGEVHAIMGPNGSGKSTLSQVLFGHPSYTVTSGDIKLDGASITDLSPEKRSHAGLFLAFQSPGAIPGVTIQTFLKQAINAQRRAADPTYKGMRIREYRELLHETMDSLSIDRSFAERYLNDGFSGGERKKTEILQMALLQPKIIVLDEIDSGLDVDALRTVARHIKQLKEELNLGIIIITHYPRILNELVPDRVHVLLNGKIVSSGDAALSHQIEKDGYDWLRI